MTKRVSIGQYVREAIEARLAEVHVSLPCKVLSYNSAKNTVNLQPLLKRKRRGKDGETAATKIEALQNVPVAFMRSQAAWVTLPLAAGDVGHVVFAERSIKDWMGKEAGLEVEPTDETLHPLAGAWFVPGGYPSASPISSPSTSHPVFHTESELHLGEKGLSNDQWVAIASLVDDRLSKLKTAFDGHVHAAGTLSAPVGGGSVTGATGGASSSPALATVAATKVKAK